MISWIVNGIKCSTYKEAYERASSLSRETNKGIEIKRIPPYKAKLLILTIGDGNNDL